MIKNIKIGKYLISKHALNRTIERLLLSQNIKLNKKQVSKNKKKAINKITYDIENYFAKSNGVLYKYIYSCIKEDGTCTKYVISKKNNKIVTVINNVRLETEENNNVLIYSFKKIINEKNEYITFNNKIIFSVLNDTIANIEPLKKAGDDLVDNIEYVA